MPPMIQAPNPHVSSLPARVSTAENGRSHWTTSRSPAAEKTIRSEEPGGPRQRHGADQDERNAEHEGGGVGR